MKDIVGSFPGGFFPDPCELLDSTPLFFIASAIRSISIRLLTIRFTMDDDGKHLIVWAMVGRCRLKVSKPELIARLLSALESMM